MNELKPCPFCGSTRLREQTHWKIVGDEDSIDSYRMYMSEVGCCDCGAFIHRGGMSCPESALTCVVTAWNRRAKEADDA